MLFALTYLTVSPGFPRQTAIVVAACACRRSSRSSRLPMLSLTDPAIFASLSRPEIPSRPSLLSATVSNLLPSRIEPNSFTFDESHTIASAGGAAKSGIGAASASHANSNRARHCQIMPERLPKRCVSLRSATVPVKPAMLL
jgi:hypothetical protein